VEEGGRTEYDISNIFLVYKRKLRHGRSTCVAKVRKRYASLLLPSPQILEEWKL
jgi:hypothetical protein